LILKAVGVLANDRKTFFAPVRVLYNRYQGVIENMKPDVFLFDRLKNTFARFYTVPVEPMKGRRGI